MIWRPRLLPAAMAAMALLLLMKLHGLVTELPDTMPRVELVAAAHAVGTEIPASAAPPAIPAAPVPEEQAERTVLEGLRARRTELDTREKAIAGREMVLQAAERRLAQRVEEMAALQQRLEAANRSNSEREEAGWRQLVRLYESMRPRDAAAIFNELDMQVLVQVVDRMREAKAAPVLGAMRPERARLLTAELARQRAQPAE